MGRKAFATKIKPPSKKTREENTEENPEIPPLPNPQPSAPTQQAPPMVSLDAMAEFLRLQDPNRNWAAELAYFSQSRGQGSGIGATPAVTIPVTTTQSTVPIPSTFPVSSTIPQESNPPIETEMTETEGISPTTQEAELEDIEAIAAYYNSDAEERAERLRREQQDKEVGDKIEETPAVETVRQEVIREEIDLNESAQKRDLMTETEFESIVEEVNRRDDTVSMAEGLDLASGAVGEDEQAVTEPISEGKASQSVGGEEEVQSEEKEAELVDPQSEAGDDRMQIDEEEQAEEIQEPEAVPPPVLKPLPVKRRLILKKGPVTGRPKPTRVSQRCLGKWAASKAKANTAESPVEIESEEEQATPKKAENEPVQATDQEEAEESPDLASGSVSPRESEHVTDPAPEATTLTAQEEEAQYQRARKRKGKAPIQKKVLTKRSRAANTGIVITEASQRTPPSRGEWSDSEYAASEESDSDSGISLEDEEYGDQSLPDDHRELVHPPVERLRYRRWTVDFTNEIAGEMKLFETQKLKGAFEGLDDGSKDIKCGKVIHYPSLDELGVRDQFLAYMNALGFEWLLPNGDPRICVRLAKEFFTTFRFRVTTDLDEVSISFRLFAGEFNMSLIEWTCRLGMCTLEEAISSEWRDRERGIPRRHVDFDPQEAWAELTHPGAGEFASTISRSVHLNDPVLRLVQLHLDANLLGQSNSAVRTSMTELYLLWCARRGRRLHLGFWTAYQCHLIATHPARNLTLCHILGAFVGTNLIITEAEDLSPLPMVRPPGLFDIPYFVRTNAVYMRLGRPHLYAMGEEATAGGRVAMLERTVTEMAEENRQIRSEMTRLASVMEQILMELANRKQEGAGEPSGHAGQDDRTQVPETVEEESVEEETEEAEAEVPAVAEEPARIVEDQAGAETERPEEQPIPPAPRRSRRHR